MINETNLTKLYDLAAQKEIISTKELNNLNFNSANITTLLENKTIERIKRGFYTLVKKKNLYEEAETYLESKDYDQAKAYFEKSYELDKNIKCCLNLIFIAIINKDYSQIAKYFDEITESDDISQKDKNYYLLLLSRIVYLSDEYKEKAFKLKLNDIKVDNEDFSEEEKASRNKIRHLVFIQRYNIALAMMTNILAKYDNPKIEDKCVFEIINRLIDVQIEEKSNILELTKSKNYTELKNYLEEIEESHPLTSVDYACLSVTKEIIRIKKTKTISPILSKHPGNLFSSISAKDYEEALKASNDFVSKRNHATANILNLLLIDINNLINEIKNNSIAGSNTIPTSDNKSSGEDILPANSLTSIITYLYQQDIDNAVASIKGYLNKIGKKEYEFLILNLLKISLLKGNLSYSKPLLILTSLSQDNYNFNIAEYIELFYQSLSLAKYEEASIYLKILENAKNLNSPVVFIEELKMLLEESTSKTKNPLVLAPAKLKNEREVVEAAIKEKKGSKVSSAKPTMPKKETVNPKNQEEDKTFIEEKMKELETNGLVILKPMFKERIEELMPIISSYKNVDAKVLTKGVKGRIALRQIIPLEEGVNFSELVVKAKEAYSNNDYKLAITYYRKLMTTGNPKHWVYAYLGLSYMRAKKKDLAIDCLIMAMAVENSHFDFSNLIDILRGKKISSELSMDSKPRFTMQEDEFTAGDDYYGISDIEEISALLTNGISLEEATAIYNLTVEEKYFTALIMAREYYRIENYAKGDFYLQLVEKSKDKTEKIKHLIEEIRKGKKFYKNRQDETSKKLTLVKIVK